MRLAVGLLVSIGVLSQALATEPGQPSSTPQQAAQASRPTTAPPKPAVTREMLKLAHGLGYKVERRGEEIFFCRNEAKLGSRFESKVCATPEQLDLIARQSQEVARKVQNQNMGRIQVKPGTE